VRKKMADLHLRRANELWPGVTGTPISGSGTL
jgi:hypothetical protein